MHSWRQVADALTPVASAVQVDRSLDASVPENGHQSCPAWLEAPEQSATRVLHVDLHMLEMAVENAIRQGRRIPWVHHMMNHHAVGRYQSQAGSIGVRAYIHSC